MMIRKKTKLNSTTTLSKSHQISTLQDVETNFLSLGSSNQIHESRLVEDILPEIQYTANPQFETDPLLTFEGILKTCLANQNQKFLNLPGYPTDIFKACSYEDLKALISDSAIKKFNDYGFRVLSKSRVSNTQKTDHVESLKKSRWYGPFFASNYYSIATINDKGEFQGLWLIVYKNDKINLRENRKTVSIGINENFYQ